MAEKVEPSLGARCLAEVLGTFLLVFFGLGAVHVAVLTGALKGLFEVAIVWGIAIMVAAFTIGAISGAHINPAITMALATHGRFPRREVLPYIAAQVLGAFLAAALLFVLFQDAILAEETRLGIPRGEPRSEMTAMCYGEYFPNPRGGPPISEVAACLAEILGTMILALVVFAVTDPRNRAAPSAGLGPAFIGLTVAALIAVMAPLTQACFNPARDFGPRVFAFLAGWGEIALPGPKPTGFLTVYILSPIVGAIAGGSLYTHLLQPCLGESAEKVNPT